jgi:diguanylate cyclase (GGDEF)-like protein/PAS domain S-box-containing protein
LPRPATSDEVSLTHALAYLQLTGAGLAVVWLVSPSITGVDRGGMISVACVATVFAAVLLRVPVQTRWSAPIVVANSLLLSGYIFFGGASASAFGLLYLVAAAGAAWFLSGVKTIVVIGWLAGTYALKLWLSHSPGEPAWPGLSGEDSGALLAGVGALWATTLLTRRLNRRLLEGDQRLGSVVEFSRDAVNGVDRDGVITLWSPGAERMYGYAASEAIGQPISLIHPPAHRGSEQEVLRRVLGGERIENHETERMSKDGSVVTVSVSVSPIWDAHRRVVGASSVARDMTASLRAQEAIRHDSLHDGLTGLPNRTLLLDLVERALARNDRLRQPLAVLFVDLDHFRLVNDSLGREAGDELLRLVAPRLLRAIRPSDTLARLGGDEFAVLCEQLPSEVSAIRIANELVSALQEPIVLGGAEHSCSASIGVAFSTPESSAAELLRDADAAMYRAKAAGGGRAELFDREMRASVLGRIRTEAALRSALADENQIYVDYQPLVSLQSGQIVGAEALARWRHPDWGPVSPMEFIPVAEESGLIHELGAQVMRRAVHECAVWQEDPDFAGIAVNVSTRQLVEPDEVARLVRDVIAAEGIPPGFLTLEITESVLIEHLDAGRGALESLAELGIGLSLDDFGTGYSSLSYLADLPFDSVKIDQSLIRNIVDMPHADALAAAIIQMGQALGKQMIAEGVETLGQATRLQALGCDIAQGFHFVQPMAPAMLTALLRHRHTWLPLIGTTTHAATAATH